MGPDPLAPDGLGGRAPRTLVFDIGGSGLKATVLDASGARQHDRVRVKTTYPCPPEKLVDDLVNLAAGLDPFDRVSAGFPGVVRDGHIVTAPHFVTKRGPGSAVDDALANRWAGFALAEVLGDALGAPARVANDADVQGAGVITGVGLELALTLGTGVGSAVFRDGRLALHLELAHHPAMRGMTYNDYIGERAREQLSRKHWNRRVCKVLVALDGLICPDAVLLGGGNASHVDMAKLHHEAPDIARKVRAVGNKGGLLGGIRLWEGRGLD